ncbi:UNVERIFIED_CONTAM: hypothetical protein GTU68_018916 [Idotea baltica]|nr:hypothetical protein [Idotea baltica]
MGFRLDYRRSVSDQASPILQHHRFFQGSSVSL